MSEAIESFLNLLDSTLGSAFYFPYLLLGVGVFFTLYLGFPQLRFFRHAWQVLSGKHTDADAPGDTTHFQALSTALSGTVGTGNIGGVAFAIYLGGPAALFWMWMTAFVGMTTKFVEVTISHRYRRTDEQGKVAGGPMHFMEHGLNMRWLAIFFAVATVISSFGSGNLPQSNNMAAGLETSFNVPPAATGLVFAILLGMVIVGGISRIAKVAATIVPFMALFYALGAFMVIGANYENVWPSLQSVFAGAFTGSAATGGFLGATLAYAFNRGVNRGLYSNEAGQGSAPIAHASAKTKEPVAEGMVAILEPFIDTLVICTLTGLVILSSGVWQEKFATDFSQFDTEIVAGYYEESDPAQVQALFAHMDIVTPKNDTVTSFTGDLIVQNGRIQSPAVTVIHNRSIAENVQVLVEGVVFEGRLPVMAGSIAHDSVALRGDSLLHSVPLTAMAFTRGFLGEYGQFAVTIGLALFAFSTALAWSYYGDRAVTYLFGARWVTPYRVAYVVAFFVATIVDTSLVWLISAVTVALMTIPNLIGLLLIRKEVKSLTQDYWKKYR